MTQANNQIAHYGQSLPQQQRSKHRAWIGVKVEAVLHGYWKDKPSDVVWAEMMRGWMEVLEGFTEAEIRGAFKSWVSDNPRKKPNEGGICAIINAKRGFELKRHPKQIEPEPEREPRSQAAKDAVGGMVAQFTRRARMYEPKEGE